MDLTHPGYKPLQPTQEVSATEVILASAAKTFPDKTGLIDGVRSWPVAEFDRLAGQFAHALSECRGDHDGPVGILGRNSAE